MALIIMAVHCTDENERFKYFDEIAANLVATSIWMRPEHRIIFVDNASNFEAKELLAEIKDSDPDHVEVITNEQNVGTAAAINMGIRKRLPGECVVKMDDDIMVNSIDWLEEMEAAIARDPSIGILGLKRKDLAQSPDRTDWAKSILRMLPHQPGESWIVVEECDDIMGSCTMFNPKLLDEVGYMYQMNKYGFDDNFMAHRSLAAGFKNAFLSHINIDHIDPGGNLYQEWKHKESGEVWNQSVEMFKKIRLGLAGYYFDPELSSELIFKPE